MDELNQHHGREWLKQMYSAIEDQQLLDDNEEIKYLKVISGFLSRWLPIQFDAQMAGLDVIMGLEAAETASAYLRC